MVNPLFQNYANALSVPLDKYGRKTESQWTRGIQRTRRGSCCL